MRGEKVVICRRIRENGGSPPHARGKAGCGDCLHYRIRITPACAGKRLPLSASPISSRDHPRMRGEKQLEPARHERLRGSPPHARGKGHRRTDGPGGGGITPACAGKSTRDGQLVTRTWDHPRMRGEKVDTSPAARILWGSPPHARGKAQKAGLVDGLGRITPACAGKSLDTLCGGRGGQDHPRMRGEKLHNQL